jgi:streptogrisin B
VGYVPDPQIHTGMAVCQVGATSRTVQCGSITKINQTIKGCDESGNCNLLYLQFEDNICTQAGDSGGPIFDPATSRAMGVISTGTVCGPGQDTSSSRIEDILQVTGATIP